MYSLHNKVAVIIGAERALGKAIAERYAALGASIVLSYTSDSEAADEVKSNILAMGAKVIALQGDTSNVDKIQYLFEKAQKTFGRIDIVVVSMGFEMEESTVGQITKKQFEQLSLVNAKRARSIMKRATQYVENKGRIIYVHADIGLFSVMGSSGSECSILTPKLMVERLAKETGHRGITVNSIIASAVNHSGIFADKDSYPQLRKSLIEACPMGRLSEVEDVANVAEFFATDLSSFVSGEQLKVSGGAT